MTDSTPFEGVEKRLVIQFAPEVIDCGILRSPFTMSDSEWQEILNEAHCTICSVKSLDNQKVYLLSESTLVVWQYGFLMKTCGRTTPFNALRLFLQPLYQAIQTIREQKGTSLESLSFLKSIGSGVNWMTYSRLEFIHPDLQIYPHENWDQEIQFLKKDIFREQEEEAPAASPRLQYSELKPLFVAFFSNGRSVTFPYNMNEILMTGIDRHSVRNLTGYDSYQEKKEQEQQLTALTPRNYMQENAQSITRKELDEFWFDPCGYSSNALFASSRHVDYFSCHISPEPETSYASLEIGCPPSTPPSGFDINNLVKHFSPAQISYTQVTVDDDDGDGGGAYDDDAASTTTASSHTRPTENPTHTVRFIQGSVECVVTHRVQISSA